MKNLEYKGYIGTIEYNRENKLLYGEVIGIQDPMSYAGRTGEELEKDFHAAIDSYLENCNAMNVQPEKAFKGSFNVRVSPELHKKITLKAIALNTSLNSIVASSLEIALGQE